MGFVRFDEHGVLCSLTGVGETGRLDGLSETRFSGASRTFRNIALRSPSGRGLRVYSGISLGVFLESVKPRPSLLVGRTPLCRSYSYSSEGNRELRFSKRGFFKGRK